MQSCSVVEACTGVLIPTCPVSRGLDLPLQLHHALLVSWCAVSLSSPTHSAPPVVVSACRRRLAIVAHRPSPVARRPSPVARRPSPVARRRSPVAASPSPVAGSLSPVASPVARRASPLVAQLAHPRRRHLGVSLPPMSSQSRGHVCRHNGVAGGRGAVARMSAIRREVGPLSWRRPLRGGARNTGPSWQQPL